MFIVHDKSPDRYDVVMWRRSDEPVFLSETRVQEKPDILRGPGPANTCLVEVDLREDVGSVRDEDILKGRVRRRPPPGIEGYDAEAVGPLRIVYGIRIIKELSILFL